MKEREAALDALLADWAERSRLPESQTTRLRALPRAEASPLPKQWWKHQFRLASTVLGQTYARGAA